MWKQRQFYENFSLSRNFCPRLSRPAGYEQSNKTKGSRMTFDGRNPRLDFLGVRSGSIGILRIYRIKG